MISQQQELIKKAYAAFNLRDIDTVLSTFHPDVHWSNGWEGGYVNGHDEVRDYWVRQWEEVDPNVEPTECRQNKNGILEVNVHQVVKDLQGNLLFDGMVKHHYKFKEGLIASMEIEKSTISEHP